MKHLTVFEKFTTENTNSSESVLESFSPKSKGVIEKLAKKFISDYLLNEFVNNSDGSTSFYSMLEDMHEKERGVSLDEIDDNYEEVEKMIKDIASKLAKSLK
jgi:hypothetical protein